jgi:hypothetical protein
VEVHSLESKLLQLSQQRDALFMEYDRLQPTKGKTMRARIRQEELEKEIATASGEIAEIRKKMRELGVYNRE